MVAQPKLFTVPGIEQQLREQTLAEYCMALPEGHLARVELAELQRRATRLAEVEPALKLAAAENDALEKKVAELSLAKPDPAIEIPQLTEVPETDAVGPKRLPCPICKLSVSTTKGPWYAHMKVKHSLVGDDIPKPEGVKWG